MINPAVTAALVAATRDEENSEDIRSKLREARAIGTSSAVVLELGEKEQALLDHALRDGTVVRTMEGRFYLNERAVSERKAGQGFMVLLILLVLTSVTASIAILVATGDV